MTVACSFMKIQVFSEGGRERKTLWGSKGSICGCNWRAQSSDSASNSFPNDFSRATMTELTLEFKRVALPVLWC